MNMPRGARGSYPLPLGQRQRREVVWYPDTDHGPRVETSGYEHLCRDCHTTIAPLEPHQHAIADGHHQHWHLPCLDQPP